MKSINRFWPFDLDEDGEIYDNPAWDLPGLTTFRVRRPQRQHKSHPSRRRQ